MTNYDNTRIDVGSCSNCGRILRVKPSGLRQKMCFTCKCGNINEIIVDEATLIQHGVIKPQIVEDIYQASNTPYFRLLDGSRLQAKWAEVKAERAEKWRDLSQEHWPPLSDIISVSMNPYVSERNARKALDTIVNRIKRIDRARPWSVELYENNGCAIRGLLAAPFYIFLGISEMRGATSHETHTTFKSVVNGLRSDDRRAQSGGEWEIWSQDQGNLWRRDPAARLLERWIFLDTDLIQTFGIHTPERNQVVHLTHEIICSKCGYAGLPTDKFCRKCGSPIKSGIHCEKCGNIVQPKDLYCVKCGSYLGSKNVAADHNESATPVQQQSSISILPISPEQQQKTPVESCNPFTADAVIKSGTLLFKCPTCVNTISVTLQRIDPIVGVSVLCSSCKNISHVPGMYLSEPRLADTRITGGIRVPIAKFSDWYYEHPYIASLIKNRQSDLLFDYGLWAFCNTCYHQYPSTVLNSFAMAQVTYFTNPNFTGDFVFNAQTPESANDMAALRSGHCSHCQDKNLIAIVTEIPDYIMTIIMSKRK